MAGRVPVHHLTPLRRLPLIEEQGLRTRSELASSLGGVLPIDEAATGRFSHGKRVSAWLSEDHARGTVDELGAGRVRWEVDPRKAQAAPASAREGDPDAYWQAARPLAEWLDEGDVPEDLEAHVHRPVRAKHLRILAPLLDADDLGAYAELVEEVADEDRLSAKALMHVAIVHTAGDWDDPAFLAACALAWRDEPDAEGLTEELMETGADKVASAALAMHGGSGEAVEALRETLEETREWSEQNGVEHDEGLLTRTALVLDTLTVDDADD